MIVGERPAELLRAAEVAGYRITPDTPARFHRHGLIERPQRHYLGRPRGTESIYPYGTCAQFVAACRVIDRFGTDYGRARWLLWNEGFPIAERYWRESLQVESDSLVVVSRHVADLGDGDEPPILSDDAITAIEAASSKRCQSLFAGALRRILHRGGFQIVLRLALEVLIGTFKPSSRSDHDDSPRQRFVFSRLLGLEPAKNKRRLVASPSWFTIQLNEFEETLKVITGAFSKYLSQIPFATFSDEETLAARSELTMLLNFFLSLEHVERNIYGRSSPVLNLLYLITRDMSVRRHAAFLLIWLIARRIPSVGDGARRFLEDIYRPSTMDLTRP